jgi:hypothetical protein
MRTDRGLIEPPIHFHGSKPHERLAKVKNRQFGLTPVSGKRWVYWQTPQCRRVVYHIVLPRVKGPSAWLQLSPTVFGLCFQAWAFYTCKGNSAAKLLPSSFRTNRLVGVGVQLVQQFTPLSKFRRLRGIGREASTNCLRSSDRGNTLSGASSRGLSGLPK